jgi:hypothetical protein
MADNILSDFGINLLEEEVDDVIFQTNEFLVRRYFYRFTRPVLVDSTDVYGTRGTCLQSSWPSGMAYKMMVKNVSRSM